MKQVFLERDQKKWVPIWFLFLVFIIAFSFGKTTAEEVKPTDEWYVVKIADQPVGYVHETLQAGTNDVLVSNSEMEIVLNRLGTKVELRFTSSAEESREGLLQKIEYGMTASQMTTRTVALVKDGRIELQSEAGGKSYTRTLNYSGRLLGPEGIKALCLQRLKNPGDKAEFLTFVPEIEAASRVFRTVVSGETVRAGNRAIPTLKIEESMEANPVKQTLWLTHDGELLMQEQPSPFGLTQVVLADRQQALSAAGGAELPEEMYASTIARTNIRLPHPRKIEMLRLKLIHRAPELGWPELAGPDQTVSSRTADTLILEIRKRPPASSSAIPVPRTEANREFLEPNAYIQSDAPEVQSLVRQVVGDERDAFKASLKLERWVAENMKFDLGIVFAPSSEVFKNRRGTCVGYATLLATLTRAAGIPSRVVMGYVYAQGMFGGHAWTEILVGKEWVPIDAAVVAEGPADAARIGFSKSSLRGGAGSIDTGPGQQMFGHVGMQILEYELAGAKKVSVPEGAKPYNLKGDEYENPWLGLKLTKPPDFKFSKLDEVWPDATVVGMEGPNGIKAALRQLEISIWQDGESVTREIMSTLGLKGKEQKRTVSGREAIVVEGADKAGVSVLGNGEVWVLIVEGKEAIQILDKIVSTLRIDDSRN
jgi:hypothetical protein